MVTSEQRAGEHSRQRPGGRSPRWGGGGGGAAGGDEVRAGVGLLVGGPVSILRISALLSVKQGTSGQRETRRKHGCEEASGRSVASGAPSLPYATQRPFPFLASSRPAQTRGLSR